MSMLGKFWEAGFSVYSDYTYPEMIYVFKTENIEWFNFREKPTLQDLLDANVPHITGYLCDETLNRAYAKWPIVR